MRAVDDAWIMRILTSAYSFGDFSRHATNEVAHDEGLRLTAIEYSKR